jgi:hypothetical protein
VTPLWCKGTGGGASLVVGPEVAGVRGEGAHDAPRVSSQTCSQTIPHHSEFTLPAETLQEFYGEFDKTDVQYLWGGGVAWARKAWALQVVRVGPGGCL